MCFVLNTELKGMIYKIIEKCGFSLIEAFMLIHMDYLIFVISFKENLEESTTGIFEKLFALINTCSHFCSLESSKNISNILSKKVF